MEDRAPGPPGDLLEVVLAICVAAPDLPEGRRGDGDEPAAREGCGNGPVGRPSAVLDLQQSREDVEEQSARVRDRSGLRDVLRSAVLDQQDAPRAAGAWLPRRRRARGL